MAVAHISFNQGTHHGALLHDALMRLELAYKNLNETRDSMALMIDGNGSLPAHYAYMQQQFGFVDDAGAKAAWEELNSILGKLNTDGQVIEVHAALVQVFNKFR